MPAPPPAMPPRLTACPVNTGATYCYLGVSATSAALLSQLQTLNPPNSDPTQYRSPPSPGYAPGQICMNITFTSTTSPLGSATRNTYSAFTVGQSFTQYLALEWSTCNLQLDSIARADPQAVLYTSVSVCGSSNNCNAPPTAAVPQSSLSSPAIRLASPPPAAPATSNSPPSCPATSSATSCTLGTFTPTGNGFMGFNYFLYSGLLTPSEVAADYPAGSFAGIVAPVSANSSAVVSGAPPGAGGGLLCMAYTVPCSQAAFNRQLCAPVGAPWALEFANTTVALCSSFLANIAHENLTFLTTPPLCGTSNCNSGYSFAYRPLSPASSQNGGPSASNPGAPTALSTTSGAERAAVATSKPLSVALLAFRVFAAFASNARV